MAKIELQSEWEARIAEYRASGLSAAAWSVANGVSVHRLYYWLKKFRDTDAQTVPQAQWLPVAFESSGSREDCLHVRIGQAIIEVKPGFDPALLIEVVRSLAKLC